MGIKFNFVRGPRDFQIWFYKHLEFFGRNIIDDKYLDIRRGEWLYRGQGYDDGPRFLSLCWSTKDFIKRHKRYHKYMDVESDWQGYIKHLSNGDYILLEGRDNCRVLTNEEVLFYEL